jgi:glyoxylase-like metal-dependent hydrolase (beta-lactamase superfamily II)
MERAQAMLTADDLPSGMIRHIRAPNPSPLTGSGTNTYLIGHGRVAVIDPGPAIPAHLDAISAALKPGESVSHIFVTHAHLDHSALARPLAEKTGAPVLAFGNATSGRSENMRRLVQSGLQSGGEGVDTAFEPDEPLADGQVIDGAGWQIEAVHTPGHMGGHLGFALGNILFSGDHVMGWSSTLVSPPDGDMGAYMAALHKLAARPWQSFLPGHGEAITSPAVRLEELIRHRQGRETAILAALASGPATAMELAQALYTEVAPALIPAASRNVLSHLIDLAERNEVSTTFLHGPNARYQRS